MMVRLPVFELEFTGKINRSKTAIRSPKSLITFQEMTYDNVLWGVRGLMRKASDLMLNRKIVLAAFVLLLFFFSLSAMLVTQFITPVVAARIIKVPEDYPTIQAAINAAIDGDTIQVAAGTYYEHVTIHHKSLKLVGENMSSTIIDGGGTGICIFIAARSRNVCISGFTIQNGGVFDPERGFEWKGAGIFLFHSDRTTIVNNNVSNNNGVGILVEGWDGGNDNNISNNLITTNVIGILLEGVSRNTLTSNTLIYNNITGILVMHSSESVIEGNTIQNTTRAGIAVEGSSNVVVRQNRVENNGLFGIIFTNCKTNLIEDNILENHHHGINLEKGSSNNIITRNLISHNERGIHLGYSNNNTITHNNICENIYFDHGVGLEIINSKDNRIHHNNFIDNHDHILQLDELSNHWDNGAEGNFWSDYEGVDQDNDGIGDSLLPHLGVDRYPLIDPWSLVKTFSVVWEEATYNVTTVTNSTVAGFDFNQPLKQIGLNVTGPTNAHGFCNITIPLELLDGTFTVVLEDTSLDHVVSQNTTHSFLYFTYSYSTHNVRIIGTTVVPDTTPPTVIAGPDQTVNEDILVTLDGSSSNDNGLIANYTWTFMDVTPKTLSGMKPAYTFERPGVYTITLIVFDAAGNWDTDKVEITVLDITNPVADAGPNQTVDEDTLVTFNGSGSSDNVIIASYRWVLTDVTTQNLTGINPTYNFKTPGDYVVTLIVTDSVGNYATDTVVITVLDLTAPVADAGGNRTVAEDALVNFDASSSIDNVGIIRFDWDFGDGTYGTGVTATHTYTELGNYTVKLTVRDAANNSDADSIIITVSIDTDRDGIPDVTDTDKDGDEIPNTWEEKYGFNPLDSADASLDPDGDGLTNLQEYQGGTNPNDHFSPFPLWIIGIVVVAVIAVIIVIYFVKVKKA